MEVRRESLTALSRRLLEKEVIDAVELRQIIDENSPSPVIVPGTAERKRPAAAEASDRPESAGDAGDMQKSK